jgi:hypothetical protein
MEPYRYRSGEVWGSDPSPTTSSPLPKETGRTGERLARRAKRARTDPGWRSRSKQSRETLLRADALDEQNDKRRREAR